MKISSGHAPQTIGYIDFHNNGEEAEDDEVTQRVKNDCSLRW